MAHLIDKDTLIAEIELELRSLINATGDYAEGRKMALVNMRGFISTLEVKDLQEEPVSIWHDASEKPERENLLIETNDGRIIHRQSINNYGMVKRWAYISVLLNLDNSCNFGKNSQELVSNDLSAEIDHLSKRYQEVSYAKLSRIAVHIAKWQRKQIIDKACEWLDGAIPDYIELKRANVDTFIDIDNKKFVEDFCKAIED